MKYMQLFLVFLLCTATTLALANGLPGDFDGDGTYGCSDVDLLVAEIAAGTNNPAFDLNGDGVVDLADLADWLVEAGMANLGVPYEVGDVNLDGEQNAVDLNILMSNLNQTGLGWCGGDLNADGVVDLGDRNVLCANAAPEVCDPGTPTEAVNWGALKSRYR